MQLQPVFDQSANVISITAVRQDIDALTGLLKNYPVVKVLRGSNVLFEARRPETEEEIRQRKLRAMESIMRSATDRKKGNKSLTQILIKERDKMRSGTYEL